MTFNLLKIWHEMGAFARGIACTLAAFSIASLVVFVERLWAFRRARRRSEAFGEEVAPLLAQREYEQIVRRAGAFRASPLAQVIATGLTVYLAALKRGQMALSPVELVRRDLTRKAAAQDNEIRRGMNVLASVGSVAPFVGLLGTVVGIISAFQGIAQEGSGGLGAVSAGIAEALVVTAFGLLVAIPAVLAFNYLSARADEISVALEQSRGELIDLLEAGMAPVATPPAPEPRLAQVQTREANVHA